VGLFGWWPAKRSRDCIAQIPVAGAKEGRSAHPAVCRRWVASAWSLVSKRADCACTADARVEFEHSSLSEEVSSSRGLTGVARVAGNTGMRTCLVSSVYPTFYVEFRVEHLHAPRYLHIGLSRAVPSSVKRKELAQVPIDKAKGYCFKLSDGCIYSPDGSRWSTDYAEVWGFDEPVRTLGILIEFPEAQTIPVGRGAKRHLQRLLSADHHPPAAALHGLSAAHLPSASAGSVSDSVQSLEHPESMLTSTSGLTGVALAGVAVDATARLPKKPAAEGCILFTVNGRVVVKGEQLIDGRRGHRREEEDEGISNMQQARERAHMTRLTLQRAFKVSRNRMRARFNNTLTEPATGAPATTAPVAPEDETDLEEVGRPSKPPSRRPSAVDGQFSFLDVTMPHSTFVNPFAFTDVPGWYGSWRIAVSLGTPMDSISLHHASTSPPLRLLESIGESLDERFLAEPTEMTEHVD
jgi:hypothetical protein